MHSKIQHASEYRAPQVTTAQSDVTIITATPTTRIQLVFWNQGVSCRFSRTQLHSPAARAITSTRTGTQNRRFQITSFMLELECSYIVTKLDSPRLSLPIFVCHFEIGAGIEDHFEVTRSDKKILSNHGQTSPFASLTVFMQIEIPSRQIFYLEYHFTS